MIWLTIADSNTQAILASSAQFPVKLVAAGQNTGNRIIVERKIREDEEL